MCQKGVIIGYFSFAENVIKVFFGILLAQFDNIDTTDIAKSSQGENN